MMGNIFDGIEFANPWFLLLLLIIPLLIWWKNFRKKRSSPAFRVTTLSGIRNVHSGGKVKWKPVLSVLRWIGMAALIIAFARPQTKSSHETIDSNGIDIVLSIDISGSMLAEDLQPNRIEAAKKVASDFVKGRVTDRIGLVIFSGESFTQSPITTDHNV